MSVARFEPSDPAQPVALVDIAHRLERYDAQVGHPELTRKQKALRRQGDVPESWAYLGIWHGLTDTLARVTVYLTELNVNGQYVDRPRWAQQRRLVPNNTALLDCYVRVLKGRADRYGAVHIYDRVWLPDTGNHTVALVVHGKATWRKCAWCFDRRTSNIKLGPAVRRWELLRNLVRLLCVDYNEANMLWPPWRRQDRLLVVPGGGERPLAVVMPFTATLAPAVDPSETRDQAVASIRAALALVAGTIDFDRCDALPELQTVWTRELEALQTSLADPSVVIDETLADQVCTGASLAAFLAPPPTTSSAKRAPSPSGPTTKLPLKRSNACGAHRPTATQRSLSLWFQPKPSPAFTARSLLAPPLPSTSTPSTSKSPAASPSTASSGPV